MKKPVTRKTWLPLTLLACFACSPPHTLTAFLNGSRWFGTGDIEVHSPDNQTCLRNRFSQLVCTDSSRTDNCLPFSRARSAQYLSMGKTSLLLIRQGTAYQHTPNER